MKVDEINLSGDTHINSFPPFYLLRVHWTPLPASDIVERGFNSRSALLSA